jgi:formylglycine-generating enzyme required for sulfatase activity
MALVTLEGTRARRSREELLVGQPDAPEVVEMLVRGRLVVARDTADGAAYEVAHEALIKGWRTLRQWLEEHAESRAVRQRLETAAAEWRRLGRSREALWGVRQLNETAVLEVGEIGNREREFIVASQRQARRRQRLYSAALLAVPTILALGYATAQYMARRDLQLHVGQFIDKGLKELADAEHGHSELLALQTRAYAAFDSQDSALGEDLWARAQHLGHTTDRAYSRAGQHFEAALAADYSNPRGRELLANSLLERALLAERSHRSQQIEDLLQRLTVYDTRGEYFRRWMAPALLSLRATPPGTHVTLGRYEKDGQQKRILAKVRDLGVTPLKEVALEPGSYLLTLTYPGRVDVRYPLVLERGATESVEVALPAPAEVPPGFIYIPPGKFLFGTADEAIRKSFLTTVPIHQLQTGAYLISRTETTYGEWIEYLNAQRPEVRARLLGTGAKGNLSGAVELRQLPDGKWQLHLQPVTQTTTARSDEPLVYAARKFRIKQNWLRFPVGGMTFDEAKEYANWLSTSGRLPGARLCDEYEWERAARGADDREWPHGDQLDGGDANFDATYNKDVAAVGPDEIGSYPLSRSPFGVDDMAGNVFEWTLSRLKRGETLTRSGGYFMAEGTQRSTNRNVFDPGFRDPGIGLRICISFPSKSESH